jgi:hypothetical protein
MDRCEAELSGKSVKLRVPLAGVGPRTDDPIKSKEHPLHVVVRV